MVREQTRLGNIRTVNGSHRPVEKRCAKAKLTRHSLQRKLLGNKRLTRDTRVRFLKSLVLPVLTYGLEVLKLGSTFWKKLESSQMGFLRGATHHWRHKGGKTNDEVREERLCLTITSLLRYKRLCYWRARTLDPSGAGCLRAAVYGRLVRGESSKVVGKEFWGLLTEDSTLLASSLKTPQDKWTLSEADRFLTECSNRTIRAVLRNS